MKLSDGAQAAIGAIGGELSARISSEALFGGEDGVLYEYPMEYGEEAQEVVENGHIIIRRGLDDFSALLPGGGRELGMDWDFELSRKRSGETWVVSASAWRSGSTPPRR